jgi:NDP-sugar pyrophosphorylase family protein
MKERITLTIDKELLLRVDEKIDGSKVKNRSHAVELLILKALSSNRPRKAVILAGGEIESKTSRFLMMVKDKSLLEWNIDLLKKHGVKEIMLCIRKNDESIKNHFKSGESFGVRIFYSEEEYPMGTAGSLKNASDFFTETIILCNADELKNIDLDDMYEFHKDGNKTCTIALTTVADPSKFGVALLNGSKIVAFVEKPQRENAPSKLVNAGLYIIEPEVLNYIPDGFSMIEQDVFPKLASQDKLYGYIFSGQWYSIKNDEYFHRAEKEWKGVM